MQYAKSKDLKVRINSVQSTQKITSAMKMVAAAKLRRAQEQAEEARPYSQRMDRMIAALAGKMSNVGGPALWLEPAQKRSFCSWS